MKLQLRTVDARGIESRLQFEWSDEPISGESLFRFELTDGGGRHYRVLIDVRELLFVGDVRRVLAQKLRRLGAGGERMGDIVMSRDTEWLVASDLYDPI